MENKILHMTLHFDGLFKNLKDDMDTCQKVAKIVSNMFAGTNGSSYDTITIIGETGVDVFVDVSGANS